MKISFSRISARLGSEPKRPVRVAARAARIRNSVERDEHERTNERLMAAAAAEPWAALGFLRRALV